MATKKAATTANVFEFPAFDMTKMSDGYREMADKSVNQTKEAYAKVKTVAEDATKAIEATMENAQSGTVELSLKAIDAARGNAEHSLSHMEALLGVKTVAQMIELQTGFFRKQAEMMVEQVKTMQDAAKKVAEDVSKPVKTVAEKAMDEIKVA
jgi:phasin